MQINIDGKIFDIPLGTIGAAVAAVLVVLAAMTMVYQVQPEEEGLLLRFGRHIETSSPGLHFKLPFGIDRVIKVPTRVVDVEAFGYRQRGDGQRAEYHDENLMLTGDLNIVLAGWDVQFSRERPDDFVFKVQDPIDTLRDISQSVMREVMGDRASILILTVGRAEIQRRAREAIQKQCDRFAMGIRISEVNLLFVDPPPEVVDAFNDLNKAEQDAVRFFEEASREYQERVPRARGEAERRILEAEGFRRRRVNVARGEAGRFTDTLAAYRLAPEVTRRRFYLEAMESRLPALSEILIFDEEIKGILPHLNMRGNEGGAL